MTQRALPGQPCQTPPRQEWTEPEKWVWRQVCKGEIADFNARYHVLDPGRDEGWSDERVISPAFLETILLKEPFRNSIPRKGVRIVGAWVKEPIDLGNACLAHEFWLDESRIDLSVDMGLLRSTELISFERSVLAAGINLSLGQIDRQLNMAGARVLGKLDMNDLSVGGRLVLNECVEFQEVDLVGLTYKRLGGFFREMPGGNPTCGLSLPDRDSAWFIAWLEKDKSYSPQPYQQLASILQAMGNSGKTNTVLYAGKQRERREARRTGNWGKWLGLGLLDWTIGYGFGYRYFRSLAWVALFTVVGVLVLSTILSHVVKYDLAETFAFSFNLLLPFIKLNDAYRITSDFNGWQLYYFYFHELLGFLLGSFVVAGLAGFTKK